MAVDIVVPRLGWTMESGVFLQWLKQEGETVRAGDMLFELEGEKAIQEVEATDDGILRIAPNGPQPGTTVPVGMLLGCLAATDEVVSWENRPVAEADNPEAAPQKSLPPAAQLPPAAPYIRRLARELGIDPARVVCRDPAGRVSAADLHAAFETPQRQLAERVISSPRARRVAAELGVDWTQLRGSGSTGRVREQDVRRAAQAGRHAKGSGHAPSVPTESEQLPGRLLPHSRLRRTIATRMVTAVQTAAPVTLTATADATNLVALRERLKATSATTEDVPAFNDLLLKLTANALLQHPLLNSQWRDDGILVPEEIHIALAIQTEDGLVAPVVRSVHTLSLEQVAATTRGLIAATRDKKLTAAQLQGGTFTLTNLGSFGIEFFTPIINLPQAAILGVGQIRKEPVIVNSEVVIRERLPLSLTFDHRILDGAPAAEFLQTLCGLIENTADRLGGRSSQ